MTPLLVLELLLVVLPLLLLLAVPPPEPLLLELEAPVPPPPPDWPSEQAAGSARPRANRGGRTSVRGLRMGLA
jgi:hypothetical protein